MSASELVDNGFVTTQARTRTADGLWRWTGSRWVPTTKNRSTPRRLGDPSSWTVGVVLAHIGWLIALTLWLAALIAIGDVIGPDGHLSRGAGAAVLVLGGLAIVATIWFGGWLAGQRRWQQLCLAPGLGTAALLLWYVVAMAVLSSEPGSDDAAAVGAMIFGIPTFVLVAVILGSGAGLTVAWRTVAHGLRRRSVTANGTP